MISIGTFDNFNIAVAGVKGSIAPAVGADLRNADGTVAGRGRDRIRPARGGGLASRRFFLGDLSPAQGGPLARRQAGDAGGCDLLDRGAEEIQPDVCLVLSPRRQRPRRPASATSSSPSTPPAIANCRPSSANSLVLPKHYWEGTDSAGPQARHLGDDAGAAAGLRPLSHQGFRRRPLGRRWSG